MMSSHSNPQVRYPRLRCQLSDHELVKPACQPIHGQDYRWQMQVPLTSGVRRIESFRGDRYSRIYKGNKMHIGSTRGKLVRVLARYELNSSLFNFPSFSIFFGEKNKIYCYLVGVQKKDLKQHQASFAPAGIHPDVPCLIQWRVEPGTTGTQLIHSIELKVCALAFSEDGRDR